MELTKKEAIELLKERYMAMSMCLDREYCAKQNAAITMAISALNTDFVTEEARNLINNQKAEIERLTLELQIMRGAANSFKMHHNTAKAEGIKEFTERLKERFGIADCIVTVNNNDIDKLVNEMAETKSEGAWKRIYDDFMKSCKS